MGEPMGSVISDDRLPLPSMPDFQLDRKGGDLAFIPDMPMANLAARPRLIDKLNLLYLHDQVNVTNSLRELEREVNAALN